MEELYLVGDKSNWFDYFTLLTNGTTLTPKYLYSPERFLIGNFICGKHGITQYGAIWLIEDQVTLKQLSDELRIGQRKIYGKLQLDSELCMNLVENTRRYSNAKKSLDSSLSLVIKELNK